MKNALSAIKKFVLVLSLLIAVFGLAQSALAAAAPAGPNFGLEQAAGTGLAVSDPRIIAANIIRIVLGFLGILGVGLIIYAGWLWMTAQGEEEKVLMAKKILTGAVIGLVICLASFAIASFVLNSLLNATDSSGGGGGGYQGSITGGGGGGDGVSLPGEGQACLKSALDVQCASGQCAAGLSCNKTTCTCQRDNRPGEGQSCDASPAQAGCQAVACSSDLVCDANRNCTCVRTPLISWISPVDASSTPNGAAGNFITIGGHYFGTTTGQVIFQGDPNNTADDKIATFPNLVNPLCTSFWRDNQIIAVVPVGAVSGPVKVVDAGGYYDTSDNARGPMIRNFLVNSLRRPGVCAVDPAQGFLNDSFTLQGAAFNGSNKNVFFGSAAALISANNISGWTNTAVNAKVPNLQPGQTSVFARIDNADSNALGFAVKNNAAADPVIEYIEPSQGPRGQYITIYGRNFKNYNAQTSSVKFYLPADPQTLINADVDFPEACRAKWWHDTYITVKVPPVAADKLGLYKVVVNNADAKASAPADFTIVSGLPGPGLCALDPSNGPVGQPVTAYGERFRAAQGEGKIKFYNLKDGSVRAWADKQIGANVPAGAVTGPVKVIDGGAQVSNSLPFRLGKCSTNSQCETGEQCCGGGTNWSGICRSAGSCSSGSAIGCGFGWTFSTSGGVCAANQEKCGIPNALSSGSQLTYHCCARGQCNALTGQCDSCAVNKPDQCDGDLKCCSTGGCKDLDGDGHTECSDGEACSGYGASQCANSYFCPNSPGKCSTYGGGNTVETGNCDFSCNNYTPCQTGLCEYSVSINKCAKKNQACGLNRTVGYAIGNITATSTASCLSGRWQMPVSSSCPANWTSLGAGVCRENNSTCSLCQTGFSCQAETAGAITGRCVINQPVCASASVCNSNNKCVKRDSGSCECCCRIGHSSEDCCAPLQCTGRCGSDKSGTGTNTYGSCSGCAAVGSTQAEHNAACNCSGTSGKFCQIDAANPAGVCRDCAAVTDPAACTQQGIGVCCVDAKSGNICKGGAGQRGISQGGPDYGYCPYYKCDTGACASTAVATSSLPNFSSQAECANKCKVPTLLGNNCYESATSTQSCDINKCVGFACINEDGTPPAAKKCGICCCDPTANQDSCKNLNAALVCKPNQSPCSGNKRGLCCGCSRDGECGGAAAVGCGTDACCHARPVVTLTVPANGATAVCRNGLISATFNQAMQTGTFTNNVVVAGEYGAAQCPDGTKYLAAAYQPTWLEKLSDWLAKLPILNKLLINQAKALAGNYCAIDGAIIGYETGDGQAIMEFKPRQPLEANRKYYVIIKGDSDVADAISNGVLSQNGVGLGQANTETFNGVVIKGKIWSFTAKNSTAADSGICRLNAVPIKPLSYLYTVSINDPADDNPLAANYDTVADSDKVFAAKAYSAEGQPIAPLEGVYNWRWDWTIDNKKVVKFKNGENALANNPAQTLVAQNIKEANTLVNARATITQDTVSGATTVGTYKESSAAVYVFMCANPWPPFKTDGSWEPWRDVAGNCSVAGGSCANTNFELYYCRDAGQAGTADDLPAILSDQAVILGTSGDQSLLKELYFFREGAPNIGGANLATTTNNTIRQGGAAGLVWQPVSVPTGQTLDKYLVYYGTESNSYTQSLPAAAPGSAAAPFIISGLNNGVKYYFALTARYISGGESVYSNEVSFTPADTLPPAMPTGLTISSTPAKAVLSWTPNADDAASYKVYYGATSGTYGASVVLSQSRCTASACTLTISGLNTGTRYYFAVSALDNRANESAKTAEIGLIIL